VKVQSARLGDVVEIDWIDSCEFTGWISQEEAYEASRSGDSVCRSVGYVFDSNKRYLTLASHIGVDNGSLTGMMRIPRTVITEVKILQRKRYAKTRLGKEATTKSSEKVP